jgi:predicted DNA-binding transcriptional regulator AlpA
MDTLLTLKEFLAANRISKATYFRLRKKGQGPRMVRISDRKILIRSEDAAEWQRRMAQPRVEQPHSATGAS